MGPAPQDCTMDVSHLAVRFHYGSHHLFDALSPLSCLTQRQKLYTDHIAVSA
jgi:hypothetical protein